MLWHIELKKKLLSTVRDILKNEDKVAIAFSGGVDSTLLSKICKDLGKQITLITIGFPNSHDLLFSKRISKLVYEPQNHITYELNDIDFAMVFQYVQSKISCTILSHIENCIAFYYLSKIVKENNLGDFFLTANGLDELFCGYNRYRHYFSNGYNSVMDFMEEKLINEFHLIGEISTVIEKNDIISIQPFLTPSFIEFAKSVPLEYKIKGSDDVLRKHIIREIALDIGVPKESALYPKKALQYGSLIHRYLLKNNLKIS
ncbi:MAG: asparagine synthase C-terminal domain-containing protein [Candidatus Nitrosocosmicus sp.]